MSRFRGAAKPQQKDPVPQDEADVVTSRSSPPHMLEDLAGSGTRECYVEVGQATAVNHGKRHENEDRTMYKDFGLSTSGSSKDAPGSVPFCTLGILDGHDTEIASDCVSTHLPGVLAKHIAAGETMVDAYTASMAELEDMLKKLASTAGTCVLSCVIAGGFVWCANLGDCRSCMATLKAEVPAAGGKLVPVTSPKVSSLCWLSRDQKASTAEERKRIKEAGGVVIDGRIEGLEPSRTLGDFDVKMAVKPGVISIVPEVRRTELSDAACTAQAIIVCATDGVWDVITGQDICDLIQSRKEIAKLQEVIGKVKKPNLQCLKDLAEDLVQFSVAKGSRDDCTAIVAMVSVPPK